MATFLLLNQFKNNFKHTNFKKNFYDDNIGINLNIKLN